MLAAGTFWPTGAAALAFEDIAGKWCTSGGSEQFDRDNLIAIRAATGERLVYPVVRYDFTPTQVTVTWTNRKGENVHTDFTFESNPNERLLIQLANTVGPRRELRRC
jgi:hypothetical protein